MKKTVLLLILVLAFAAAGAARILLTTSANIVTSLGSNVATAYNKATVTSVTFDTKNQTISGVIELGNTAQPGATPQVGTFTIEGNQLSLDLDTLAFNRKLTLTAGQLTAVQGIITSTQNSIESGLITTGVITGTQEPGQ